MCLYLGLPIRVIWVSVLQHVVIQHVFYTSIGCKSSCGSGNCDGMSDCSAEMVKEDLSGNPVLLYNLYTSGCTLQYYGGCNHQSRTCYYKNSKALTT